MSHARNPQQQMPFVAARQSARPLLLCFALLPLTAAHGYPTSITAMAAAASNNEPIVVVTGSNKGIGHEILKKIAPSASVAVLAARNPEAGEAAAEQLRKKDGLQSVVFEQVDLNSSESIRAFAKRMEEEHGRVDVLVNNAGVAFKGKDPTPFREQASPTLRTNLYGTVELIEAMTPLLRKSSDPKIVNVASQSGRLSILDTDKGKQREVSSPDVTRAWVLEMAKEFEADVKAGRHAEKGWPSTCYGMSKLLLIAYARAFAAEEAARHGKEKPIWLASCCPGYCDTDMTSHKGTRSAEHGARTPAWLALRGREEGARSGGFFYDEREIAW